jgi:hypothetical protein
MPSIATATLDSEALWSAADQERRRRRMTRRALCAELGVSGASYCSWSYGGGMSQDAIARIVQWLQIADIRGFIKMDIPP